MDAETKEPGTRDKILIAAATMLGENPTARLSVRAVAARAQVSTGSLRHFFPRNAISSTLSSPGSTTLTSQTTRSTNAPCRRPSASSRACD